MYRAGTKTEARKNEVDEDLLHSIANVFEVKSRPKPDRRWGREAEVRQVALLEHPLTYERMKVDSILRSAPVVRRSMLGRSNVTPYWYRFYDLILQLNRDAKTRRSLARYDPQTF